MSHPFGDQLSRHLHRKHGLSQSKLAAGILQAPAIITDMCKGRRLTGPQARERVVAMIQWLHRQEALATCEEANALLAAAGMFPLQGSAPAEAPLLQQLQGQLAQATENQSPAPDAGRATPRHNLPVQSTTFVGRESENAQIATLLADPQCRLLTLVGPGGVGKTRLALQAVTDQLDRYEHGIWFVALAPLLAADLVAATCLEALNLGQQPHLTPDEQLLYYLRRKHLLLILDNFEHLPAAVGLVKAILNAASQVKLLVTTRERLKVQEEWVLMVDGLDTPPAMTTQLETAQLAALEACSAVRLFVERARRLQPTFALTASNAAAIAHICQRVDGIPLAIELAAGWSRLMPAAAIAQAIAQDFTFLSSAWQDLPDRHQSLALVFAHSWRLLTTREQVALHQLVAFRGGFRADAAKAVAGVSLALVGDLVDKSWLRVSENGRFDLHELIRQFIARQNMLVVGEVQFTETALAETEALDRHSRYYAAFLQSQEPFLYGPRQREVLNELLAEVDNIRQGWRWAVAHVEVESISKYLKSWQWLGEVRAWNDEMAQVFGEAAERLKALLLTESHHANDTGIKVTLARTLHCQARHVESTEQAEILCRESLTYWPEEGTTNIYHTDRTYVSVLLAESLYDQGRYTEAESLCRQTLRVCQDNCDQVSLQYVYTALGFNAYTQGRFAEAQRWFEQSLIVANNLGEKVHKSTALSMLAEIFANQGDYQYAEQYAWEIHAIGETFDFKQGVSCSYTHLGYIALLTGDLGQAHQYFQHCLQFGEETNTDFIRMNTRRWLGNIAYRQDDFPTAHQWFSEALAIACSIHRQTDVAIALTGLGKVACAQGDLSSARTYFHQALHLLQVTGALPDLLDVLVSVSQLWLQAGTNEAAAQLLAFARQHPSLLPLGQQGAAQVYTQLQVVLPEGRLVAAQTVGAAMTLDEVIALAFTEQ